MSPTPSSRGPGVRLVQIGFFFSVYHLQAAEPEEYSINILKNNPFV